VVNLVYKLRIMVTHQRVTLALPTNSSQYFLIYENIGEFLLRSRS
jgi:hypothetical protein